MKELLKYLKKESNSKSYSRGMQYYDSGAVESVEQNGNTFIGIVEGSDTYEVEITIDEGNIETDCDCPYHLDGICKHIVAVGLAIAAGQYSKIIATPQIPNKAQAVFKFKNPIEVPKNTADSSAKNATLLKDITFERVFNHASAEQKIWFLKQVLSKDADLRTQFLNFVQPAVEKMPPPPPLTVEIVPPIAEKPLGIIEIIACTKKEIESKEINFGNLPSVKKAQLDILFHTYQSQINTYLAKADFVRAMAVIMGLHEFFLASPLYSKHAVFKDFLAEKLAIVAKAIKGQLAIVAQKIIDLVFERAKLAQYSHIDKQESHCLAIFTPFLITITPSTDLARYLYQAILTFDADLSIYPPHLLFHIADLTQSTDLWYSTAKKLANSDAQIAQKLLIRYAKDNRKNDFFNLAQKLFDTDTKTHAEFLSQYVQLTDYPKLYKQIWFYLAEQAMNKNNYTVFDKLIPILLDTELDTYLVHFSSKNPIQYTQILLRLKRYDDILEYAISQQKTPNFEQIISPILSIYPLDSFGMIRQNVYDLLDKDQSRSACKKICEWLKLMQQIKGFEKETQVFINYMYEIKIPTLKNEMVLARFFG